MKVNKRALLAAAVGAVLLVAGRAEAQSALPKITEAQAGDGFLFLTQQLADKAGFFRKEGYELQVTDVGSGPRAVAAMMGGSAVYSTLGMINLINARSQGGELIAIATESNLIDIQVVLSNAALKKSGIDPSMPIDEKIKRMRDLKISITSPGSSTDTMLRTLLKARKINPDEALRIIPTGSPTNMLAAIENNATDGFVWGAPQTLIAEKRGLGKIVVDPFKGEIPEINGVPYMVITTTADTLKNKPEMLRATVRALTRAMKFVQDQPEEAKKIARSVYPEMDDAIFNAAWENYRTAIPTTPIISRSQFENTRKWLEITAAAPLAVRYEDSIVSKMAQDAAAEILGK